MLDSKLIGMLWFKLLQGSLCCVLRENIFDLLLSRGICQNALSWTSMPLGRVETCIVPIIVVS